MVKDPMKLSEALKLLDKSNKDHYTTDGQPSLKALSELTGRKITREDLKAVSSGKAEQAKEQNTEKDDDEAELKLKEALSKASLTLRAAQKAYDDAAINLDNFIIQKNRHMGRITDAHDIKAFQKSQFEQRKAEADRRQKMEAMLAGIN